MIRINFLHLGLSTGSIRSHGHRKFSRKPPDAEQSSQGTVNSGWLRAAGAEELVQPQRLSGASRPPVDFTVRQHAEERRASQPASIARWCAPSG